MRGNVALIKKDTGVVENIIVVGKSFIPPLGYEIRPLPDYQVHIGDVWDGEKYTDTHTEETLLKNLNPSQDEINKAEFELNTINLLLELGVI